MGYMDQLCKRAAACGWDYDEGGAAAEEQEVGNVMGQVEGLCG